jgi:hypothetical protein
MFLIVRLLYNVILYVLQERIVCFFSFAVQKYAIFANLPRVFSCGGALVLIF